MALEITGKLIQKMAVQEGTSKNGNAWRKQEFVIETEDQFPRKICANLWADNIDQLAQVEIGDKVKMSFNLESRSFNDRWYTDVRAWKLEKADVAPIPTPQPPSADTTLPETPKVNEFPGDFLSATDDVNDLPF